MPGKGLIIDLTMHEKDIFLSWLRSDEDPEKRDLVPCLHGSFVDCLEVLEAERFSSDPGQKERTQQ